MALLRLIFFILILIVASSGSVFADQEGGVDADFTLDEKKITQLKSQLKDHLPPVRLTPDLPFYFLKSLGEEIRVALVREVESRSQLQLNYAEKRLAEALKEAEKGKYHIADKLLQKYEESIEKIKLELETVKSDKINTSKIIDRLSLSLYKEQAVAEVIRESSKRSDKEGQERAEVMKKRADFRARNYLKELFTLKVSSKDFNPDFVSPIPLPRQTGSLEE